MMSRKWFGLLLATLLVLGSLVTSSAMALDGEELDEEESDDGDGDDEDGGVICHDDVSCLERCAQQLISGYACRL